jgi:hypothetical protein
LSVRSLAVVLYLLSLMVLSFSILLTPGKNGDFLNTSDSGFFFGIAREIDQHDGMVDRYSLSHYPTGWSIGYGEQGQPLLLVMLYRGLHWLDPGIGLTDACKLWSPLLLALSLLPAFLVGRELAGDLAGAAAALLLCLMTNLIYWCKVGAFDREALQTFLTLWAVFLSLKTLRARSLSSLLWWGGLTGAVLGLFALSWSGWWYLLPAILAAPLLSLALRFLEAWWREKKVEEAVLSTTREHLPQILGLLVALGVVGAVVYGVAGAGLDYWRGIAAGLWGYLPSSLSWVAGGAVVVGALYFGWEGGKRSRRLGVGWVLVSVLVGAVLLWVWGGMPSGGLTFSRYASEQATMGSWRELPPQFYGSELVGKLVFLLMGVGLLFLLWRRREGDLLPLAWLVVVMGLVWPGEGQVRFVRQWWPFLAVAAGVGLGFLASLSRRVFLQPGLPQPDWSKAPLALALCGAVLVSPLISNSYRVAERTVAPPDWEMSGLNSGLVETFTWLRENSPENSIVAVEWSYGHLLTGVSGRGSVCDGVECLGEEGVWENDPVHYPVRPPDYIYRVEGNRGLIYGVDILRKQGAVNGRRTDIQFLPTMGVEELRWLLRTYRDNYGCRIDYVVLHARQYWEAYYYKNRDAPLSKVLEANRLSTRIRSLQREEGRWVFDFGENRRSVVLTENGEAYLRTENGNLLLDGVAYLSLNERGGVQDFNFRPPSAVDLRETLVLLLRGENLVGGWLVEGVSESIASIPDPVGMLAFTDPGSIPYLELAHRSSNGLVLLFRVDHTRV